MPDWVEHASSEKGKWMFRCKWEHGQLEFDLHIRVLRLVWFVALLGGAVTGYLVIFLRGGVC